MRKKAYSPLKNTIVTIIYSLTFFIGSLVALFFCALSWLAAIGGGGVCSNEIVQEVTSPDGQSKAILYLRNCGATVDYTSHVTILDSSGEFENGKGNVLRAEGSWAWDAIVIAWQNNSTLGVFHQIPTGHQHVKNERVVNYEIIHEPCKSEIISEALGPDSKFKAVVYEWHCGQNVLNMTHVSIFESGKVYGYRQGNILRTLGSNHENSIETIWVDSYTLKVVHRVPDELIVHQRVKQFEIGVTYEKLER